MDTRALGQGVAQLDNVDSKLSIIFIDRNALDDAHGSAMTTIASSTPGVNVTRIAESAVSSPRTRQALTWAGDFPDQKRLRSLAPFVAMVEPSD